MQPSASNSSLSNAAFLGGKRKSRKEKKVKKEKGKKSVKHGGKKQRRTRRR